MKKPSWMIKEEAAEKAKKARAATKRVFIDNSEVNADREREDGYQALMEDTGNSY